eukprot:sb/3466534/
MYSVVSPDHSVGVIQANNPEVCAVLGDENCLLVCDLEIETLEEGQWLVTWYKMRHNGIWDPDPIRECPRISITGDALTLRLSNVMYEDRGIYRCEVIDLEGNYAPSDAEFNVIVIPQDCVSDDLIVSDDNDLPLQRMKIKVETPVSCNVADKVHLVALVENKPKKVKVEWFKMVGVTEVPLNKKRMKMTTHKVFSNVKIRSVVPDDSGVYRVKVSGGGDVAINHIILNVNTDNCEIEISEMMKRAFQSADHHKLGADNDIGADPENGAILSDLGPSGQLTPTQIREIMTQLGLGLRRGSMEDLIYNSINEDRMVDYNTFIEKFILQYKSDLSGSL